MHFVARFFFSFPRKTGRFSFVSQQQNRPTLLLRVRQKTKVRALTSFFLQPETREKKKINSRVVRDLRDFKMTTSDSYEPNHHTSSSRPCCSEAIVTQSSEPVCASIGEMANAPLLTAHTEKKNFSFMCARPTEDSLLLLLLLALSYRFQIATFFSKAKKFRQINLLTFSSKI